MQPACSQYKLSNSLSGSISCIYFQDFFALSLEVSSCVCLEAAIFVVVALLPQTLADQTKMDCLFCVCRCFHRKNIFVKDIKMHIDYIDRTSFLKTYRKVNCFTRFQSSGLHTLKTYNPGIVLKSIRTHAFNSLGIIYFCPMWLLSLSLYT